jgi:polyisoprenoid-binding protein YceI
VSIDTNLAAAPASGLATGVWHLDPTRSSVEFHVPHFYGLITVKGRFERYEGTLNLAGHPAIELVIAADSLDTKKAPRNKHLRGADFFDVSNHPQVRFEADDATLSGDALQLRGQLSAAGKNIPLDVNATLTPAGDEFEIEASALADHRELGMTWSPLGVMRTPSKLIVRGRLVRAESKEPTT